MSVYDFRGNISNALVVSSNDVSRLIIRAPHTYKTYEIDKKNGGKRSIAQPAKETKYIQRLLMTQLFSRLPVHSCAVAYKDGASIKKNAELHKNNQYISKFDFTNFFGSIKEPDISAHLASVFGDELSDETIKDISRISCIKHKDLPGLCLSIGAPSSPVLSNTIMYLFDQIVHEWSVERGITFTRYADDLTFSSNTKGLFSEIEPFLSQVLKKLPYPVLSLNSKKTIHVSKKNQRRITGLVLDNDGRVSLGRDRKRLISTMIHHYSCGRLSDEETMRLQGLLGFAEDAEPLFVSRMRGKYGILVISELFQKRGKKLEK
ncbi:Retron-type reverse transcriptase [Pseudomonas sp. 22 E 5]|uniref:retron St85 family RNA-directed DNA polymerase n=1 Tax=Pseudomonas TaxID=286 RepID=UPI0008121AA7|nr:MULTISPECIES: retron St85 family RNA-directed DNA polymerase [Pseudomonas]NMZ32589.1 RNA-directed DNA polymerase [Pseudomonas proteolytica]CRM80489.1 Retron-type reverse transcriptase [Pseudomonas sp. 22 E 5]